MVAEPRSEMQTSSSDAAGMACAHHWQIATPNGETSDGVCKYCGATRSFANYSARKAMTRSAKAAPTIRA